jgi:hypothetical protein
VLVAQNSAGLWTPVTYPANRRKAVTAVLYAIPCAALAVAQVAAWWRCRTLRRALHRERAVAIVEQAAWARDVAALEAQQKASTARQEREHAVLAQAAAVVDAELVASGLRDDIPRGGIDG